MSSPQIAIVGMACLYPDAHSPQELWENVLSQRRAFRKLPSERLSLNDYYSPDKTIPDAIYSQKAAVIEGYEFDRIAYKVVGSTFRSADLAHWLALDIASQALHDADFTDGKDLPKETTGVLLGNTLTGELSRANTLRLRWPYVHHRVEDQLIKQGLSAEERQIFLNELEKRFKEPFEPIGEESLAGNLANTIAGRICNYFDLKGSGYIVDGACSSSLLAVANGCSALMAEDLDVALVGGVDISIDPFELVGFAKTGALASGEMKVYDQASNGFIPGEGCGFLVLMRHEDALAQNKRIYAFIQGWGISSDGKGGITRPEVEGQLFALNRAYKRAKFTGDTIAYFEGHGTGTAVGDATELEVLSRIHSDAENKAAISSIKANIGHTKAAAGIAGLIKATMAVHRQIIPPMTGCDRPHAKLTQDSATLQVLKEGQIWPNSLPLRAAVSAMGFGGINSHIIIEGLSQIRRHSLTLTEQSLIHSPQDAELFLFSSNSKEDLQEQVNQLLNIVPRISQSEMTDLAIELAKKVNPHLPHRLGIIASSPDTLTNRLVDAQALHLSQDQNNIFINSEKQINKIVFLFPGQAAPVYLNGGLWERRFPEIKQLYNNAQLPKSKNNIVTNIAQPAIVTASLAGLHLLESLNIKADLAIGHSLGELCALYWAKAYDETQLINIAKVRGQAMAQLGSPTGKMASINADADTVRGLLNGRIVKIAGLNSPYQTIVSGEDLGVKDVIEKAQNKDIKTVYLPVSHAFHSPLVAQAVQPLEYYLQQSSLNSLQKTVISTVTGEKLPFETNWRSLLLEQITSPVRFMDAVKVAEKEVDLFIEVGSGSILSRLVKDITDIPVISLDSGSESLQGLLKAVAVMFVNGVKVNYQGLFEDRFSRPFNLDYQPRFIANPCENKGIESIRSYISEDIANKEELSTINSKLLTISEGITKKEELLTINSEISNIEVIRQLVAQKTELPLETIENHHRLLGDLHLNSISVSQLVIEAARQLDLSPPHSPTDYANATLEDVAEALEELEQNNTQIPEESIPMGIDSWIKAFTVDLVEKPLIKPHINPEKVGNWQIISHSDHPLLPVLSVLQPTLKQDNEKGVIICLRPNPDESEIDLLVKGAKLAIKEKIPFILIQQEGGYGSFARTFYLENRQIPTYVIDIPFHHPNALNIILSEITANDGYTEVYYDEEGKRFIRQLNLLPKVSDAQNGRKPGTPTENDILLVTGGGKGIASECALSLAKEKKATLAILGRSKPEDNQELADNLARMKAANIPVHYYSCDVSDAELVKQTIGEIKANLGEITGILHSAGVNTPKLIQNIEKENFVRTLAPKVKGLQHILTQINPDALNYLITFGSIIAETGLKGEADYGLANEWLGRIVGEFGQKYPNCRCLNLEWSVWSGIGMGERLGTVESLRNEGITPISPDIGIKYLHSLLNQDLPSSSIIVAGRFGEPPTLSLQPQELPFLRFLEAKKVHYTGIELITEAELSLDNDPYLQDHVYQGEYIFPGVMGLEAIAQVATALLSHLDPPSVPLKKGETTSSPPLLREDRGDQITFESVKFNRPIVVSADEPLKIQIATLITDSGKIKAVIRCANTGFSIDHFEAIISHSSVGAQGLRPSEGLRPNPLNNQPNQTKPNINPDTDLYGNLLFHKGRFQRIKGYSHLKATECIAEINTDQQTPWFSRYLPQSLILGDAGARDAVIHALQACVPHATILPTGIESLTVYSANLGENQFVCAKERQHQGDTFVYDIEVVDNDGNCLEIWQGLELKVIKDKNPQDPWIPSFLPCYLEREIKKVIPTADLTFILDQDATVERRVRSDRSLRKLTSSPNVIHRRGDGKPELSDNEAVSVSHAQDLTLVVQGASACDLEPIMPRDQSMWRDLLGVRYFDLAQVISKEYDENLNVSATRIWTAKESIKKMGFDSDLPLLLADQSQNLTSSIVWLASETVRIMTIMVSVQRFERPLIFAVLLEEVKAEVPIS